MPPREKITKDMILQSAFEITEELGFEAVTSRNIASRLGCSIQPVFSHFPDMETLKRETFDYACRIFMGEVLVYKDDPDFFEHVTRWTLDLARQRPHLYKLLYLSSGFEGSDFKKVMAGYESNTAMIEKMKTVYGLSEDGCRKILMKACLFLMGICTMIVINGMEFSDEYVLRLMKETVRDAVRGEKER